ncbi:hypothetical protein O1611_g2473 [Lasiodiplodia mahajangana]|uniref:Uncharacterized protein n=1 Tax=Lasiodiplodia mahajangana TaxID=1108764 RepID=A0ACC2JVB9_9PEZI|nr:hypothetical protein O1611_g2473 [Lasiodiplodia mahajangana]
MCACMWAVIWADAVLSRAPCSVTADVMKRFAPRGVSCNTAHDEDLSFRQEPHLLATKQATTPATGQLPECLLNWGFSYLTNERCKSRRDINKAQFYLATFPFITPLPSYLPSANLGGQGHGMDIHSWLERSRSDRISHYSSSTSRTSPTKCLGQLEIAPVNPDIVVQISRNDARIPTDLLKMLDALDNFQSRVGIVPDYLALEIEARAKEDRELYNFQPLRFYQTTEAILSSYPKLCLNRVLDIFSEATECFNEGHSEATWNSLVHWPVFRLALGPLTGSAKAAADRRTQGQSHQVHVRAMPCTTARLQGRPHGAKMVDFCFFIDPSGDDASQIDEIREAREYINHTDYQPLRRRPIVLSAESKKPDEGCKDAQIQLGVWLAAQWALLENLLQSSATQSALIPFLPALIIQGHEWSFAATTKSGRHTILWVGQAIGSTNSVLGMFQIIHVLRYIAEWTADSEHNNSISRIDTAPASNSSVGIWLSYGGADGTPRFPDPMVNSADGQGQMRVSEDTLNQSAY